MKRLLLLSVFAMMALFSKAQDSTRLYQNFDVDDSAGAGLDHFPPGWSVYHVVDGGQIWKHFSMYGVNNTSCLEFNGYQGGADHDNDAWLMAPKLNLSAFTSVFLNFSAVYLYVGDSLHVKVSTNYSGTGNPMASGVTWIEPVHTGIMKDDSNNVSLFRNFQVNLTPYISTHTYVAFEYISSNISGSRWSLDSIFTTGTTNPHAGINNVAEDKLALNIVGNGSSSEVKVGFDVIPGSYQLEIYDLTGRKIREVQMTAKEGYQVYTISNLSMIRGMYLIKLANDKLYGTTKFIVE